MVSVLIMIIAVLMVSSFFFSYSTVLFSLAIVAVVADITGIYAALKFTVLRVRKAYFFSAGFGFFLLGALLYLFKSFGILEEGFITFWSLYLGSTALVCLLSIALADNINTMRKQLLTLSNTLEKKVQERTLKLEKLTHRLEKLSTIDGLTEIANRRHFDETFLSLWRSNRRYHRTLSICIVDVDHFKAYNDYYGHQQGDECLKIIAKMLDTFGRRSDDLVARYGGEEFAIILSDLRLEDLIRIMNTVRESIENLAIPHPHSPTAKIVTISIGAAFCYPNTEISKEESLKAADDALYRAKNKGRNRVEFTESFVSQELKN